VDKRIKAGILTFGLLFVISVVGSIVFFLIDLFGGRNVALGTCFLIFIGWTYFTIYSFIK